LKTIALGKNKKDKPLLSLNAKTQKSRDLNNNTEKKRKRSKRFSW